jgi:retinol dehydrogenase-12/retinol dehydrogenase-13
VARGLASRGVPLVLACRDLGRAHEVAAELARGPRRPAGAPVTAAQLDLASLVSVRDFAAGLAAAGTRVRLLVNNAGVFCDRRLLTTDGFEMTIGVNFLGTFLLTRLLLPLLREAAARGEEPRIVNVASAAALYGRLAPGARAFTHGPHGFRGYAASKLALVHFTRALSDELQGSGVTVVAVHPGDAATGIWKGEGTLMKVVGPLMRRVLRSPAQAALPVLRAALEPVSAETAGRLVGDGGNEIASARFEDEAARRDLLAAASRAVGL